MSLTLIAFAIAAAAQAQTTYEMDKNHSKLGFSVKHLGISNVEGNFKNFNAQLKSNKEDFTDAVIEMTAEVKSINTEVEMRDRDLKKAVWLDARKYPTIIFKSTAFKKLNDKDYKLEGNITLHGITKPIGLDVIYNGKTQNSKTKKYVVGFTVSGKLDRNDFEVGNEASGESTVSNEVRLKSNVEFILNSEYPKLIPAQTPSK